MKEPYSRPTKLSDPCNDWRPAELKEILATPDCDLSLRHYHALFQIGCPAGSYDESVYFLSMGLDFIRTHRDKSLDCISDIIWFVSKHSKLLKDDGLLEPICQKIQSCLQGWTNDFQIRHFDEKACDENGWRLKHFDHVDRQEVVCLMLDDLERFESQAEWADRFLDDLITSNLPEKAAWTIELARSQHDVYHPPVRTRFVEVFNDLNLLLKKKQLVERSPLFPFASPTYWQDTLREIGIND